MQEVSKRENPLRCSHCGGSGILFLPCECAACHGNGHRNGTLIPRSALILRGVIHAEGGRIFAHALLGPSRSYDKRGLDALGLIAKGVA